MLLYRNTSVSFLENVCHHNHLFIWKLLTWLITKGQFGHCSIIYKVSIKEINTVSLKTDILDMIIKNELNCRKGRIETNTLMHEY